jgi:hypothetical protein
MSIQITLEDHTGNVSHQAKVVENVPVQRILPAIVTALGLPIINPMGRAIIYHLSHDGRRLQEDETLEAAGVKDGDTITIVPEMTAGGYVPEFEDLIESLKSIQRQSNTKSPIVQVTAPVELPTPDQMKVKLVPSHLLSQLEETRADESYWSSVGWAFLGAALGVIVNWITSNQFTITRPSLIVILVFIICSALAFVATRRYSGRSKAIRTAMIAAGVETKTKLPSIQKTD